MSYVSQASNKESEYILNKGIFAGKLKEKQQQQILNCFLLISPSLL